MAFINFEKKEINFKVVYYGPPLGGKTTNLVHLHEVMPDRSKGKLTILSTQQDRTLYFDFLPLQSDAIKGYVSRFQLYTVPGQPIYDKTRRIVLTAVDGIVFVADSQWDKMTDNADSFKDLKTNLQSHGRHLEQIPYIVQLNKRDLPNIAPVPYLDFLFNHEHVKATCIESVAVGGKGVGDCVNLICKMVMAKFIEQHDVAVAAAS